MHLPDIQRQIRNIYKLLHDIKCQRGNTPISMESVTEFTYLIKLLFCNEFSLETGVVVLVRKVGNWSVYIFNAEFSKNISFTADIIFRALMTFTLNFFQFSCLVYVLALHALMLPQHGLEFLWENLSNSRYQSFAASRKAWEFEKRRHRKWKYLIPLLLNLLNIHCS